MTTMMSRDVDESAPIYPCLITVPPSGTSTACREIAGSLAGSGLRMYEGYLRKAETPSSRWMRDMARDDVTLLMAAVIVVLAFVGIVLSAASLLAPQTSSGGSSWGDWMDHWNSPSQSAGPNWFAWTVLALSLILLPTGLFVVYRAWRVSGSPEPQVASPAPTPSLPPPAATRSPPVLAAPLPPEEPPAGAPVSEMSLMRLLNEDERRMYLEIRDHGGAMYQRDLVAVGIFSRAKVTRTLDKLETKGVVVREAHGMTNRIRIVNGVAK